jgi:hypothetical protein
MGAVVNYISNQTRATVGVDSPIKISTIDDDKVTGWIDWGTTYTDAVPGNGQGWKSGETAGIDLGEIYGGGAVSYWLKIENNANGIIESNLSFYINCDEGLSKTVTQTDLSIEDFEQISVTVYDWNSHVDPIEERKIIINDIFDTTTYPGDYQMDGAGHLLIWFESYLFPSGENGDKYYVKIDINFANDAYGHYDIATQMLEDPTDW